MTLFGFHAEISENILTKNYITWFPQFKQVSTQKQN
jgi:hypothetical protein